MADKLKPDWSGEDFLSRCVNGLIEIKPLYRLMKNQARQVMIKTATKNGVPWEENYRNLENSQAKSLLEQITNPNLTYPDYYRVPFHAYDEGNLCWQAAFEADSATQSMALRIWKGEKLTPETAQHRLRHSFHEILDSYSPKVVRDILDLGCSVGISTLALHRFYQHRQQPASVQTIGLDLSPYMLSVAKVRDEQNEIAQWVHSLAEKTDFSDNSFDIITVQFVLHELPRTATKAIFREIFRILRPGGVLGIADQNPASPVIQNLPPALFVLLKSTEPWCDDYHTFDVESALIDVGFDYKITTPSDPRHRAIIALKPIS